MNWLAKLVGLCCDIPTGYYVSRHIDGMGWMTAREMIGGRIIVRNPAYPWVSHVSSAPSCYQALNEAEVYFGFLILESYKAHA